MSEAIEFDFSEEAGATNAEMTDELAKLTPMTATELDSLLPKKADKQRLAEVLKIVGSAASQNNKVAELEENFAELGGVVVKLLSKYLRVI